MENQNIYNIVHDLVSLVTPGWNGKQFIHRLLDSILEQTYRPIEYIYVDDGSTDGTADIVQSYKDKFKKPILISNSFKEKMVESVKH